MELRAPFPYFGGKSRIASVIHSRLGPVDTYVEPFFGSGAVLLTNPTPAKYETVNDVNGFVSNFWRAVAADPEAVAHYADWPILENDLHARHRWLWERREDFREALEADPEWYDARVAGWWAWGMSTFVNPAFCVDAPKRSKPKSEGYTLPGGVHARSRPLPEHLARLSVRMRSVRVLCGDWRRAVTPIMVQPPKGGVAGVFLDPPYDQIDMDGGCYGEHDAPIFQEVLSWAVENARPDLRIILAGYDSRPMPEGWTEYSWKGMPGHSHNNDGNNLRERLWFSPHCLDPEASPFDFLE